jgi:hypothetical protein
MIFHITYYGKTGVQFASDLINHENKQIHSFEQIQEKLETNNYIQQFFPFQKNLCWILDNLINKISVYKFSFFIRYNFFLQKYRLYHVYQNEYLKGFLLSNL